MRRSGAWARFIALVAGLASAGGCAGTAAVPAVEPGEPEVDAADDPERAIRALIGYEAHFVLRWNGSRIGSAVESLRQSRDGLHFQRHERVSVTRGGVLEHTDTQIDIMTDPLLRAEVVTIQQISNGIVTSGRADRRRDGDWIAIHHDQPAVRIDRDTVPAELVPLIVASTRGRAGSDDARDALFDGPVMWPGYGFATMRQVVRRDDQLGLVAELHTRHGLVRHRLTRAQNGTLLHIASNDGVSAMRVDERALAAPFDPPELVDSTSLPILPSATAPDRLAASSDVLIIEPVASPLPPPIPGQRVHAADHTWRVELYSGDLATVPVPSELALEPIRVDPEIQRLADAIIAESNEFPMVAGRRGEIAALVHATSDLLEDDLGAAVTDARGALTLGRGDCTAHAALFAALAGARGIATRLVTGYRLDGERLFRHRWAIADAGGAWIAVDPTYGEAPSSARLVGLAIHDNSPVDLAIIVDKVFTGFADAHARRVN